MSSDDQQPRNNSSAPGKDQKRQKVDCNMKSPTRNCLRRIQKDVADLFREPLPGIFVCMDERNLTKVWALVTGPFDTPYEGGLFLFEMDFPDDYPIHPPKVTLKTTGDGKVRFNPNLYKNGKVCLSILGTWMGPSWSPAQNIGSVLLSIQSLMNARPYNNEPGYENDHDLDKIQNYNRIIRHEVLRFAVLEMAGDTSMNRFLPAKIRSLVKDIFLSFTDTYILTCESEKHVLDGQRFCDPHKNNTGTFSYGKIQADIKELRQKRSMEQGET